MVDPRLQTRATELFGVRFPIVQTGMGWVAGPSLVVGTANAGGLGIITGLTQGTPEKLANEIARCKDMTDKPFGVNLTFLSILNQGIGNIKALLRVDILADYVDWAC